MNASELLNYIPKEKLEELCLEYKVNYQVKKLDGLTMFQLLLYSFLTTRRNSYRVMEEFYHSIAFEEIANQVHSGVRYNSIRDRLVAINPHYFEAIFKYCFEKFEGQLDKRQNLILFDSTLVAASSKLLENGIRINKQGDKRYIKYTLGFKDIPAHVRIFKAQEYASEDIALFETIMSSGALPDDIVVFDRGISSRQVYESFNENHLQFVTRVNENIRTNVLVEYQILESENENHLLFQSDQQVQLFNRKQKGTKSYLRLIKCTDKESKKTILFLTNIENLTTSEIAAIYKKRWEIEVFFRFIKQQLNFSHLMSRNENGIMVILYMTLISSILLTAYKKSNQLKGYKIPKIKLANEIEALIIKDIIIKCGGNPSKIDQYLNSS